MAPLWYIYVMGVWGYVGIEFCGIYDSSNRVSDSPRGGGGGGGGVLRLVIAAFSKK